jgi:hypothetical protein
MTNGFFDSFKPTAALGAFVLALLAANSSAWACGNRVGHGPGERHGGGARAPDWHDAHPGEWRGWNVWNVPIEIGPEGPPPPPPDGASPYGPPPDAPPPDMGPSPGPSPSADDALYYQRLRDQRAQLYAEIEGLKAQRRQVKVVDPHSDQIRDINAQIEERRDKVLWLSNQLRGTGPH